MYIPNKERINKTLQFVDLLTCFFILNFTSTFGHYYTCLNVECMTFTGSKKCLKVKQTYATYKY